MNSVEDRLEDAASELRGQLRYLDLSSPDGLIRRQHRRRTAARASAVAALAVLTVGVLALRSTPTSTPVAAPPSPIAAPATAPVTPQEPAPESTVAVTAPAFDSIPLGGCPSSESVTPMPALIGLTMEQAKAALSDACITVSMTYTEAGAPANAPAYPDGIVGAQYPAAGADVASAADGPTLTVFAKLPDSSTPKVTASTTPANATPIPPVSGANG